MSEAVICGANQWADFYMITAYVMKGLRELNEYLRNDGSAVKNVWLIQFQGKNYMKVNTALKIVINLLNASAALI